MPPLGVSVLRCVRLLRIFKVTKQVLFQNKKQHSTEKHFRKSLIVGHRIGCNATGNYQLVECMAIFAICRVYFEQCYLIVMRRNETSSKNGPIRIWHVLFDRLIGCLSIKPSSDQVHACLEKIERGHSSVRCTAMISRILCVDNAWKDNINFKKNSSNVCIQTQIM